jgi:hypothetical protein
MLDKRRKLSRFLSLGCQTGFVHVWMDLWAGADDAHSSHLDLQTHESRRVSTFTARGST